MTDGAKKAIIYGTVGTVGLIVTYAFFSIRRQIGLLKNVKVDFANINVLSTNNSEIGLNVGLKVNNLSDIRVVTNNINVDVYLDGVFVNKVIEKMPQVIAGKTTSVIRFNLFFNPLDVVKNIKVEDIIKAFDFRNITLHIKGYVSGSVDGINFSNFPFEMNKKIGELM
jgi:LEA14-like dessication related protein